MKYIICSDIHGNKDRLSAIIRHSKVGSPGSRLVHLGDICDIGPYTEECMDILEHYNAIELIGNHGLAHVMGHQITPYDKTLDVGPFIERIRRKVIDDKMHFVLELDGFVLSHAGVPDLLYKEQLDIFTTFSVTALNKFMKELFISGEKYHKLFYDEDYSPLWYRPGSKISGEPNDLAPFPQIFGHTPRSYYDPKYIKLGEDKNCVYMTDGYNKDGTYLYVVLEDGEASTVVFEP